MKRRDCHLPTRTPAVVIALTLGLASALPAQPARQGGPPNLEPALRLTGVFRDGRVVSLTAEPLTVVLPLPVKEKVLAAGAAPTGYFIELRDEASNVALRAALDDPTLVVMEYEDPEQPGRIVSKEIHVEEATFSVIVPAPPESRSIRFLRVRPGQEAVPLLERAHEEIGSFELPQGGRR